MNPARHLLALGAGLGLAAAAAAQDWQTEASATWADNLSRTSYAPDRASAALYAGSMTADWHRQLAPAWSASWQAGAGLEQVPVFPGLDNRHYGGSAGLRRKFGLGPFAPVLSGNASVTRYDFHERGRSHWRTEVGLKLSQRLTESWLVAAGGSWAEDAAKSRLFDVQNHRATLETTWDPLDRLQLTAGASRLWGQLTANANQDIYAQALAGGFGPWVKNYYNTIPYGKSWAYGDDWVAYRIDCHADIWWLGASLKLDEHTSLPLRYESVDVLNQAHVHYRTEFWSLSLLHRF